MPRVVAPVVVLLVLLLVAAGCGDDGRLPESPPRAAPSEPVDASPPSGTPPAAPPSTPSDVYGEVTVLGTATRVDAACIELTADTGVTWSLLGPGLDAVGQGDRIKVVGVSRPEDQGGACPGTPFHVRRLGIVD